MSAAARAARERRAAVDARRQYDALEPLEGVIASSAAMMAAMARVRKLAKSKLTVLIYGDSGTGKELVARAIHNQSNRSERPWLATNCAGFSEGVLESELFGHVKGAFTGAVADRRGLFEEADGGTLFLDEIGDMPLAMQAKLLRTLENGEIVRVGSNRATHVDVRVVAATNKNLKEQVEQGKFRDDLFWRLNQATIFLAPLRDRREDIPPLVHHFIQQANAAHHKRVAGISHDAMALLVRYNWPGNVRQLANVVNQMVVLAEADALDVHDITDPAIRGNTEIVPVSAAVLPNMTLREIEKRAIQLALRQHDGNREKAARQLGIGARTLYRKLREFDIK
ncbi:MAG: sigma-54 dependent transcriptional regulator [Phycisphaerae bacterium]